MTQTIASATTLPTSTPEQQGVSSAAISAFVSAADRELDTLHSLILVRHGHIIAQGWWDPYRSTDPHLLFSLSKSFTSTAIGMLVDEGKLTVDDLVLDIFPEDAPADPSDNLRAMRVHHLLSMSTGHETEPLLRLAEQQGRTWVQGFLAHPVEHAPGTHFLYNSLATYMLSAIVQKITGGRMIDYLRPRLFEPLGIANPTWETSPDGIDTGGWGLSITTNDIANFGQLYLQRGEWKGEQLISSSWVGQASSKQIPNGSDPNSDWNQGYGYQFWRCRHNAYRGDGAFGQYCVIMPDQDTVVAITAGLLDMQQVLNLLWDHILPALSPDALPDDSVAQSALADQLAALRLKAPQGQPSSPTAASVSGKVYRLDENDEQIEAISLTFAASAELTIANSAGEQRIAVGYGEWLRSAADLERFGVNRLIVNDQGKWKAAAAGAWTDENTYVVKLWWYEKPFARTFTFHFAGDSLDVDQHVNVGFGPTERPSLHGHAA